MGLLFSDTAPDTEIVTADQVIQQYGVRPGDLGMKDATDPQAELRSLIESWIKQIASHIRVRLGTTVPADSPSREAIRGILIGNVGNVITFAMQQRTSPVVQLGNYAVTIIQSSRVTENLDEELEPFKNLLSEGGGTSGDSWAFVFWSSGDGTNA